MGLVLRFVLVTFWNAVRPREHSIRSPCRHPRVALPSLPMPRAPHVALSCTLLSANHDHDHLCIPATPALKPPISILLNVSQGYHYPPCLSLTRYPFIIATILRPRLCRCHTSLLLHIRLAIHLLHLTPSPIIVLSYSPSDVHAGTNVCPKAWRVGQLAADFE